MSNTSRIAPSRRALLLTGATAFVLAGCGIGPSNPPAKIYVLEPEFSAVDGPKVDWALAIGRTDMANAYDTDRVAIERGQNMDFYADAQWTDSTPRMLQSLLVLAFEKSGRIGAVSRDGGGERADYMLMTEIRHFEARYDNGDGAPLIVVDIMAKVVTTAHRDVIATHDFSHQMRATENSVPAAIAAFNQATGAALEEIVGWTLRAPGAPAQAASDTMAAPATHRRHRRR
jgi:cholesterol transport system auxiliary component